MEEPEQAPPWRPEDGPAPVMRTYPAGRQPGLSVRMGGRWVPARVTARADYADGRVAYHVVVTPPGESGGTHRAYWWPSDGLRVQR